MPFRFIAIRRAHRAGAIALFLALLLSACDGTATGGGGDQAGSSGLDSLDAERGKDKLSHYDFAQGKLIATGGAMDLAIEGRGFFILKNQARNVYFRRPASFSQDADGYLNLGNAGTRLQGIALSSDTVPYPDIDSGAVSGATPATTVGASDLVDIRFPFNDTAPASATTEVELAGNLDAGAAGHGSIVYSQAFLHHAEAGDLLIGLRNASGQPLGIQEGDILTLSADAGDARASAGFAVTPGSTMNGLVGAIAAFIRGQAVGAGATATAELLSLPEAARGAICLYGNSGAIRNFQVTSDRPVSAPLVARAFAVPALIPAGTIRLVAATETLRSAATAADPLDEAFDADGNALGLEAGDRISFSGSLGGDPAPAVSPFAYASGPSGTVMGDILRKLAEQFGLAVGNGSSVDDASVALDPAGSDDDIPDGSIVIRGRPGTAFAIGDVSIRATDANGARPSPIFFNTNLNMTVLRDAADDEIRETALDVFDRSGKTHHLSFSFAPSGVPGRWSWSAGLGGTEKILKGGRGGLRFGSDGSLDSLLSDSKDARLEFDPGSGLATVSLAIRAGGMTQLRDSATAALVAQNGFPSGRLKEIAIGEDGIIAGTYTNGKSRALFRIPLADFPNPAGLTLIGENSFLETSGSGKPVVIWGSASGASLFRSGTLEYATEAEYARICGAGAKRQAGLQGL
jgi:flagellar hook protein FlgE